MQALQLQGTQLALIDSFSLRRGSEGTAEVRSESIAGGPQRLVARMNIGTEGGETWVGPSWLGGRLYFYMQGMGTGAAAYGFDPSRDKYLRAVAHAFVSGFSMIDGRRAIEATAPGDGSVCGEAGANPCAVQLSERFDFKPSRAPAAQP